MQSFAPREILALDGGGILGRERVSGKYQGPLYAAHVYRERLSANVRTD